MIAAAMVAAAVSIAGQAFVPNRLTVVGGDTVTWSNSDFTAHDVRAADGSFDSGRLERFGAFSRRVGAVGAVPYLCTIHPFMHGEVDVVAALLHGPSGPVLAGAPVRLDGRAATGTSAVTLQRQAADRTWQGAATTAPDADGAFAFVVTADTSATYRALTAAGASPPVAVPVTAQAAVRLTVRHRRVRVRTEPPAPHARAVLQRYERWHYRWRTHARSRFDAHGRTTFKLPARVRGLVRVVLPGNRHAPALATSTPVRLKSGKPAADPLDAIGHEDQAPLGA
jgi:hypothetical protein